MGMSRSAMAFNMVDLPHPVSWQGAAASRNIGVCTARMLLVPDSQNLYWVAP
jgi:hypothetical protein